MAEDKIIQIKLPGEMSQLFDDIKEVRTKNFENTTNQQIVIDAIKAYHQQRVMK